MLTAGLTDVAVYGNTLTVTGGAANENPMTILYGNGAIAAERLDVRGNSVVTDGGGASIIEMRGNYNYLENAIFAGNTVSGRTVWGVTNLGAVADFAHTTITHNDLQGTVSVGASVFVEGT